MKGRYLTVSAVHMPPYVNLIYKNGKVSLEGYFGKVWKILEARVNFTSEIISEEFRDGVFYSRNSLRDVILHPSAVPSELVEDFYVSVPLLGSRYSIYIKDSNEVNSSESFIRNWSLGLWASTVLIIFLFIILIYLNFNISRRFSSSNISESIEVKDNIIKCPVNNDFISKAKLREKTTDICELKNLHEGSLGNCFIIALAVFSSQGYFLSSRRTSVRMLILIFVVFSMIMYNSYSALLVSQLTLREKFLPFTSLEEIPYKAQDYSLCVRKNSLPYQHFKDNETSTALKSKWRKIINKKPCLKGVIPADVMCAPYVAFLETPAIMKESISRNFKCKITNLKDKYFHTEFSILLIKSVTREIRYEINSEIIRYREVGILRHLIKKYIGQDDLASPGEDSLLQVTFDHIKGVLIVYGYCICGSFIMLLVELFMYQIFYQFKICKRCTEHV